LVFLKARIFLWLSTCTGNIIMLFFVGGDTGEEAGLQRETGTLRNAIHVESVPVLKVCVCHVAMV
jgi:hypothetical protein